MYSVGEAIDHIVRGTFHLDCPEMTLTSGSPEAREQLLGAGSIRQAADRSLEFNFYTKDPAARDFGKRSGEGFPRLIPPEEMWVLICVDGHGTEWRSEAILPDNLTHTDSGWWHFSGGIHELSWERTIEGAPPDSAFLAIAYVGEFTVPANVSTTTVKSVGEREIAMSMQRHRAEWECQDYKFAAEPGNGVLELTAFRKSAQFVPYFEMRLTSALEFVLGRPLSWAAMQKLEGKRQVFRVRGGTNGPDVTRFPPFEAHGFDPDGWPWKIFCAFLNYVEAYGRAERHPLERWVHAVVAGGGAYIETQVRAVCAAVESVLTLGEFKTIGTPEPKLVDELRTAIEAIEAVEAAKLRGETIDRIRGALAMLRQVSAKNKLRVLTKKKLVPAENVEGWEAWRNALMHGEDRPINEQTMLQGRQARMLFHRLVCAVVGYDGFVTDYAERGFEKVKLAKVDFPTLG